MERKFLKDKRSLRQIASESLLKFSDVFYTINQLRAWLTSNFLSAFLWIEDLLHNFFDHGPYTLCE